MSEITGVKHTKSRTLPLKRLVDLVNSRSTGGAFRLAKGKSPLVVIEVIQHEGIILIRCVYIHGGSQQLFSGDKEVVPLNRGVFEDDGWFGPGGYEKLGMMPT